MIFEQQQQQPPPSPSPSSSAPCKDISGDPLFYAALSCSPPRQIERGSVVILTEHQPKHTQDPNYDKLMSSTTSVNNNNNNLTYSPTSTISTHPYSTMLGGGGSKNLAGAPAVPPPPAMHNYYPEFRQGHGDPLLKAAMKTTWRCTSVEYTAPECPDSPRLHELARQKRIASGSRALSCSVPRDIINIDGTSATNAASMWPFVISDSVDVDHLHLEAAAANVKERRFVMLDGQGHEVAEAEDDIEEIYSDF